MEAQTTSFDAIGTHWTIQAQLKTPAWEQLLRQLHSRIEQFDATYSRFRSDSFVTQLSKHEGTYPMPEDGLPLLKFYEQLYKITNGKVTPLVGQTMADSGYDADYSFKVKTLTYPPRWDDVLGYNPTHLTIKQAALLDFGAAGKGYLVDIVSDLLSKAGAEEYLINAGGDILHRSISNTAVEIGLENPFDTSEAIGTVLLGNQSICASAGSKRAWGAYHHIIDPDTLASAADIVATWAIADSAMVADGVATALFFVDPTVLLKSFTFSYIVVDSEGGVRHSRELPVKLFEATA